MEHDTGTAGDSDVVVVSASQSRYHAWQLLDRNVEVRMRLDVVERLEREVICAYKILRPPAHRFRRCRGSIDHTAGAAPCIYQPRPSLSSQLPDAAGSSETPPRRTKERARSKKRGISRHKHLRKADQQRRNSRA